ncbi:hypothetical protein CVT25_009126 [Psilocybe cyanescens]|uniref:CHAT domain-containing protein n=1 Tax=Psilocybe cyanescens TaxID=93625 RepID=A0A409XDT3_PSICY|nr:hypothetical protein CVT25_009126 [Psilocybe cyanescens]
MAFLYPQLNHLTTIIDSFPNSKLDASPPNSQDLISSSKFMSVSPILETVVVSNNIGRGSAGRTADIDGNTPIAIDNLINDEEASEIVGHAISLMAECKAELSLSDLDTAIFLFRQVFGSRPIAHTLPIDAVKYLASALGVRFMYTNQNEDFMECLARRLQDLDQLIHPDQSTTVIRQEDETDTQDTLELAKGSLINFQKSTSLHVLNTVIFLVQQSAPYFSFGSTTLFVAITTLVDVFYNRLNHFHDTTASDLGEAISSLQDAMIPRTEQARQYSLTDAWMQLCGLLIERLNLTGDIFDLQRALACLKAGTTEVTRTATANVHEQFSSAIELYKRFTKSGNMGDLNTAVILFREVIAERPHRTEHYIAGVHNLASLLAVRFKYDGQQSDLDEAIFFHRQAVELRLSPHPDRSQLLNSLANTLRTRFDQAGEQSDLDEAISLHRQALELRLAPNPSRSSSLSNLANSLWIRFNEKNRRSDLDEVISLGRQALELVLRPHPNRSMLLDDMAYALWTRFNQGGEQSDLDEAIYLNRQALELRPAPHPERSVSLNNLVNALWTRFNQQDEQSVLDEAISLHRQALELRPAPHPDRFMSLSNLALVLRTQFSRGGEQGDLDEAIYLNREALELRPAPHPERSMSFNNLANTLRTRFNQTGEQSDLDEAISLHRQAVELRLAPHPERSKSLNNLANALWAQFEQRGEQSDLDESISLHRQALELQPASHPDRSMSLSNLATALWTQFSQGGEQGDLDAVIYLDRQALELRPVTHPDRSMSLSNLATALHTQFNQCGERSDLDEAISLHRQALELRFPPHPERATSLNNLANTLWTQFSQRGEQSDLDEAMSFFSAAAQYLFQPPSHRLNFAKIWIGLAVQSQHSSAIHAYEAALQALPQVAALSLDVQSRQKALTTGTDGLARDASICTILSGNLDKAIEFLEAGRGIFWSQVLSLRSPFHRLRNIAPNGPELADRLQNIAKELENGSHRDVTAQLLDNRKKLSIDQEASRLNRLNEEWEQNILKARELHGFEDFLLPPRLSSLKPAASEYPVVFLIENDIRSHCLIMTSTNIHHIPLPNLQTPILKILVDSIRMASSQSVISRSFIDQTRDTITKLLGEERGISFENDGGDSDGTFRPVLKMLWDELVKPVIDYLNIKKSNQMPILQWCPTGRFTFLPIHAAGDYDDPLAINCAPDYFVSSYTPAVAALLSDPSASTTETFRMMAVIESQQLASTKDELNKIRQYVSRDALVELGIPGSPAEIEDVAARLSTVSVVHFACHGTQDALKPLDSGLKLSDGLLRISRIMKEKMPNGSLAFLCACETAMGDQNIPDEAMSLAACLLFSGFRRVVATMWEMMDKDGPTISDAFYRELFRGPDGKTAGEPDVTKSAYALHIAVKELRSRKVSFRRWIPFIHMGK